MDISGPERQSGDGSPEVSIIVPARNEEASIGDCLRSLVAQTGVDFQIIVVDDGSTDRTREIAETIAANSGNVRLISAQPLPPGWTGKNNAVVSGVSAARGRWLLFTDADTMHLPGSLARALTEAKENDVAMLSYSPEQVAVTFWEIAVLPVAFAELAYAYPPKLVSDPLSPIAAANGQYILIRRSAYESVGGHRAIASDLLEDVALARAVKGSGLKLRFRYRADAVRTRMYRSFRQLREGWTKNLALLFPRPGWLAARLLLMWGSAWGAFFIASIGFAGRGRPWWMSALISGPMFLGIRMRRANFTWDMEILGAMFGLPMFAYLLLRSRRAHANGSVFWKGRGYAVSSPKNATIPVRGQGGPTSLSGIG
jgi:glycosyltransferase involved in cell wall biosynthesis